MLKRGFSFAPGYRLEAFLGRGQFGQVWRATAPGGTVCAVKFIDLSGGEGAKEHEGIKRVKQIRHANLMPITAIWLLDVNGKAMEEASALVTETVSIPREFDPLATADSLRAAPEAERTRPQSAEATKAFMTPAEEPAWLAVAMLLGGKSLQQRLRECVKDGLPGIPPKELLAYIDESAKGLDFLNIAQHDLGAGLVAIQHCDVKPANIVLIGSSAVVCDFGLARILSRNQVTATSASGTPAYMAPEAIAGRPSKTSDQYSLAVTYYHLRTGTLPIADGTLWEVLDAHKSGKLDLSRVPESEQAVLKRATALHWEQRFESNGDFVEALREALRAEGFTRPVLASGGDQAATPETVHASQPQQQTAKAGGTPTLVEVDDRLPNAVHTIRESRPLETLIEQTPVEKTVVEKAPVEHAALEHTALGQPLYQPAQSSLPIGSVVQTTAPEDEAAWWQQPRLLAGAAALALLPFMAAAFMLMRGVDNTGGANTGGANVGGGSGQSQNDVELPAQPKSAAEWTAEAVAGLSDFASAQAKFDQAIELDSSLLEPYPLILAGHQGSVRGLHFVPDRPQMISVADDLSAFGWDLSAQQALPVGSATSLLAPVKLHALQGLIEASLLGPDGTWIAFASQAGELWVQSLQEPNKGTNRNTGEGEPIALALRNADQSLVVATDFPPGVKLMQLTGSSASSSAGEELKGFELSEAPKSIAVDPLGKWLLVLTQQGTLQKAAWDDVQASVGKSAAPRFDTVTSSGSVVRVMAACRGEGSSEAFVVTGGELGEVTLWPLGTTDQPVRPTQLHQAPISAIAVSARGIQGPVVTGDDAGTIVFWRSDSGEPLVKKSAHQNSITALSMSQDARWLAAASMDGTVTLWKLDDKSLPMVRLGAEDLGDAATVALDPLGRWLAAGYAGGRVALWDLRHVMLLVGKVQEQSQPASPKVAPDRSGTSI